MTGLPLSRRGTLVVPTENGHSVTTVDGKTGNVDLSGSYLPFTGKPSKDISALGVYLPEAHGAVGDGVTDDTTAVQAALDAIPTSGGRLLLSKTYRITSVSCAKPVTITGVGGSLIGDGSLSPIRALSGFVSSSATADCLTLSGIGCTLRDFAVINDAASTPTTGNGIKWTGASQGVMDGVTVLGFYNCVQTTGAYWMMTNCHIYDPVHYGVYLNNNSSTYNDHGDLGIVNCIVAKMYKSWGDGGTGIRWEAGGGIRIVGTKVNAGGQPGNANPGRFAYGIDLVASFSTASTGELTVSGGGVANCVTSAIRVTDSGNSSGFVDVIIDGVQINSCSTGCVGITVGAVDPGHDNNIRNVLIANNIFRNIPGPGIIASNMKQLMIGPNQWAGMSSSSPLITLAGGTDTGTGLIGVTLAHQDVANNDSLDIVSDLRTFGNNGNLDGAMSYDYTRSVHLTTAGTWVTAFSFDAPVQSGGLFEVEVAGKNWSVGGASLRQVRAYDAPTPVGSVALTTVGTDVAAGAGGGNLAIQYVTTGNNRVIVQVQTSNASFPNFDGRVTLKVVSGQVSKFRKGA